MRLRTTIAAALLGQICWDAGDNASTEWYPQGITTSNDAAGGAPSRIVASWYDNCSTSNHDSPGCTTAPTDDRQYSKGVRLSVLDTSTYQYRLVLLVEPFVNASGNWTYKPVRIHAGGIAWYGHQQHREHAPLPGVPDVDGTPVDQHLDLTEQMELRRHQTDPLPDRGFQAPRSATARRSPSRGTGNSPAVLMCREPARGTIAVGRGTRPGRS